MSSAPSEAARRRGHDAPGRAGESRTRGRCPSQSCCWAVVSRLRRRSGRGGGAPLKVLVGREPQREPVVPILSTAGGVKRRCSQQPQREPVVPILVDAPLKHLARRLVQHRWGGARAGKAEGRGGGGRRGDAARETVAGQREKGKKCTRGRRGGDRGGLQAQGVKGGGAARLRLWTGATSPSQSRAPERGTCRGRVSAAHPAEA